MAFPPGNLKNLCKDKNRYRYIPSSCTFDFLPKKNRKHQPAAFYKLPFRIARFKITDDTYETVVTNLDGLNFPADELKKLYNMRWGIETSFRELKYTVGLLHFHAKKVEYIYQEVPETGEFDLFIDLSLTTKATKDIRKRAPKTVP